MTSPENDSNRDVPEQLSGTPATPTESEAIDRTPSRPADERAGYDVSAVSGDTDAVRPQ